MPIDGVDFFVRLIDLPHSVGGFVKPNSDGTYSVYLNSRLSHHANLLSYDHEKKHIEHNDFHRCADVQKMEREAG